MPREIGYNQAELCWGTAGKITDADVVRVLDAIVDLGGTRVRMSAQLGTVDNIDKVIRLCRARGLKPLLMLKGNPSLGSANTPGVFGALCKTVATRYGPLGVGDLANSVDSLQLFNEVNKGSNDPPGTTAASYAQFLRAGYEAIKSVHSSCTVISAGTTSAMPGFGVTDPVEWHRGLIAAGAGQWCDAFGMHYYSNDVDPTSTTRQFKYLTDVRQLLVDNGLGDKKIWITELGVAFPSSFSKGLPNLVAARDRLKLMLEGVLAFDWTVPFVYAVKDYKGGDSGGSFGMVTADFAPKSPIYELAQSYGGPVDPGDMTPPTAPTAPVASEATASSVLVRYGPSSDDVGVTVYRVYDATGKRMGQTDYIGQTSLILTGLTPGTPYTDCYVTAVDAAGNESDPSTTFDFTTDAPSGSFVSSAGTFEGSTTPTTFNQLGLGVTVTGGVALPNPPTTDGEYLTTWPRVELQRTPDHFFRISLASVAAGPDRTAMAGARLSADGTQGMFAVAPGGVSDSLAIWMVQGGKRVSVAGINVPAGTPADDLLITVTGNVYTARLIAPGEVVVAEVPWTDLAGRFTGALNLGVGMAWLHRRVNGIYYAPPGVTGWATATGLATVRPRGGGELWPLGLIDESDWPQFFATGSWESLI